MRALHPCLLVACVAALFGCESGQPSSPERGGEQTSAADEDAGWDGGYVSVPIGPPLFEGIDAGLSCCESRGHRDPGDAGPAPVPERLQQLRSAAKTPPAISGGTLAVTKAGTFALIGDSDRDQIYVVDLTSSAVRKVALPSGSEPGRVAFEGSTTGHVALRGTGEVAHVDLATGEVQRTAVCSHPRGVAVDAPRARLMVACLDGQLVQLDSATRKVVARAQLPDDLRDVIVGEAGVEFVTRFRSAELLRLDASQAVQATTRPPNGLSFGFAGMVPISTGTPGVLDNTKGLPAPAGGPAAPLALPPSPPTTFSPALAWRTLRAPNGNMWMLHQQSQNEQVVVSQPSGYGGSGCSPITGGKVTEFAADGTPSRKMKIPLLGSSVDVALSPNTRWLAVASPGGYALRQPTLRVYLTADMQTPDLSDSCGSPRHSPNEESESQVTAVAFDDNNVLYAFSREPAQLQILAEPHYDDTSGLVLTSKATIALDPSSVRDTGHDMFHADVSGRGLACASCHGEALDDAHVWNFEKIGPRRTQNMRGGLLATAPFHWDGDMMSIGHLADEVMTRRMGGFPVSKELADALAQWIDKQPSLTLPAKDATAVARGKTLFNAAGTQCATCHAGSALTNNQSVDVGTGGTFQVPSLRGLALRAPFMHNGCAKTLEQRFEAACGGGDRHGVTSTLSASQLADLIAYLKTL